LHRPLSLPKRAAFDKLSGCGVGFHPALPGRTLENSLVGWVSNPVFEVQKRSFWGRGGFVDNQKLRFWTPIFITVPRLARRLQVSEPDIFALRCLTADGRRFTMTTGEPHARFNAD
jgi:hypothetical protein